MSGTVKKVLSKLAPPALTAKREDEPSESYHIRTTSSPTALSDQSNSEDDHTRRKSKRSSFMDTLRQKTRSSSRGTSESPRTNGDAHPHPNGLPRPNTQNRRMSMTEMKEERKSDREAKEKMEAEERKRKHREAWEQDPAKNNYGDLPINQSQGGAKIHDSSIPKLTPLAEIPSMEVGTRVAFRARVHHIRPLGSKIVFFVFRAQLTTLQGVLAQTQPSRVASPQPANGDAHQDAQDHAQEHLVSQNMIRWSEGLSRESIVRVVGIIQHPPEEEGQHEVKSTSVKEIEVMIEKIHVIASPSSHLPFQLDDVSRTNNDHRVGDKTRFMNRVLDLRSPASQAIFRIHAAVCEIFRDTLVKRNFIEIQSSKFQASGTESGAAVFKVDYFRRPAFLAQSPQLAKQMCIAADMERVFEIGPVFRAENSNTHRHLTEFTGLDLEMAFEEDYHEVMRVIDDTLKAIFRGLQERYRTEIETVKRTFPHEDLVILDETPVIKYADGIKMLREAGYREHGDADSGRELSDDEDLSTPAERRLGELVKEKFNGADYYILDKFPTDVRPFYTMPDPENPKFSNSFDIFLRGEEILSGGQRIHHAPMLIERMQEANVDPDSMPDYVNGFRWGCPPHGGGGVGLERIVMLFLKLGDVRWASLFPRDPRSFAVQGEDPAEASMRAATAMILKGPEARTFEVGKGRGEMPPLENLIARYGDATNTSWVDPAWTVWRDDVTGAAVGYMPQGHFAITFGNPLCEPSQIPRVVKAYLSFLARPDINLKPIWCCVDHRTEQYLAEELGWSAVIAVAEERVNPMEVDPVNEDKTVRRKVHRAEREGVKLHEVNGEPDAKLREQIEERCKDWAESRKGTQIHLTGVRPFDDVKHRKYFYATDKDGKICALVVLAQLAPVHGFQIKWALEFPDAPLGAIEYIVAHVIKKLGDAGVRTATFGAGAAQSLQGGDNVGGFRFNTLSKTYNGLSHTFHLTSKGDFRGKFGIEQDPLFICYPKGSLGVRGVEAIMAALQKPK